MSSRFLLVLAAVGTFATGGASSVYAMTLQEAVSLAISTNPEVGAVANDRLAVDEELRQGRALYYPQVDLRAETGPEYSENATVDAQGHDDGKWRHRSQASLTLSQLLFDGFFADSEVERQQARVKSAAYRVGETAEFVGLDAIEAYLEVLRHRERVLIAEDNVDVHRTTLGGVQQRAQGGGGNIADVRQAEARLSSAESTLVQTRGDLRDAEALFERVIGEKPDSLDAPTIPVDVLPADVDAAVGVSIENSPTVQFARADIEAAQADVKQQEASLYPDLRLEVGGSVADNLDGKTETEHDATALVVLRWNLYRGGADSARIREFKHRLAEASDSLRINERRVAEDARVSWNAIEVSRQNVQILAQNVEANQRTRDVYAQQFDIGQRGLLDLLDADNELFLSRDNLITARYGEIFATYRLLATMGALVETVGAPAPEAATLASDN
jgi:adhesin transport system outer membrane protein